MQIPVPLQGNNIDIQTKSIFTKQHGSVTTNYSEGKSDHNGGMMNAGNGPMAADMGCTEEELKHKLQEIEFNFKLDQQRVENIEGFLDPVVPLGTVYVRNRGQKPSTGNG